MVCGPATPASPWGQISGPAPDLQNGNLQFPCRFGMHRKLQDALLWNAGLSQSSLQFTMWQGVQGFWKTQLLKCDPLERQTQGPRRKFGVSCSRPCNMLATVETSWLAPSMDYQDLDRTYFSQALCQSPDDTAGFWKDSSVDRTTGVTISKPDECDRESHGV